MVTHFQKMEMIRPCLKSWKPDFYTDSIAKRVTLRRPLGNCFVDFLYGDMSQQSCMLFRFDFQSKLFFQESHTAQKDDGPSCRHTCFVQRRRGLCIHQQKLLEIEDSFDFARDDFMSTYWSLVGTPNFTVAFAIGLFCSFLLQLWKIFYI